MFLLIQFCLEVCELFHRYELSHILLTSLFHPKKENEIYTDLCPILLGFSEVVKEGRNPSNGQNSGGVRYGYFNDDQFDFILTKVRKLIDSHKSVESECLTMIDSLEKDIEEFKKSLQLFNNLLKKLDSDKSKKIRKTDVHKLVEMHNLEYNKELETELVFAIDYLSKAQKFFDDNKKFNELYLKAAKHHSKGLNTRLYKIKNFHLKMQDDIKILKRNTSILRYF